MTTIVAAPDSPSVSPERVTPLRPSEAMRLGRMLYPRGSTCVASDDDGDGVRDGVIGVCAAGAMAAGFGLTPVPWRTEWVSPVMHRDWPRVPCPDGRRGYCYAQSTWDQIAHLNDDHGWSTARIADWLEGLGL